MGAVEYMSLNSLNKSSPKSFILDHIKWSILTANLKNNKMKDEQIKFNFI